MSRLIITILSAGVITLVSASCVKAQDDDRLAKFVPTELWACNYNEGQGPDDLDVVAGKWNAYMDENEADAYLAWTLTPQYFTDDKTSTYFGSAPGKTVMKWARGATITTRPAARSWPNLAKHSIVAPTSDSYPGPSNYRLMMTLDPRIRASSPSPTA